MPQMAPIMWLMILAFSTFSMLLMVNTIYFTTNKSTPSNKEETHKLLMSSILSWKW